MGSFGRTSRVALALSSTEALPKGHSRNGSGEEAKAKATFVLDKLSDKNLAYSSSSLIRHELYEIKLSWKPFLLNVFHNSLNSITEPEPKPFNERAKPGQTSPYFTHFLLRCLNFKMVSNNTVVQPTSRSKSLFL